MGRHSDKIGARTIATLGIICLAAATLMYTLLSQNSSFYIIIIASAVSGFGTAMFFPANNSAVMAKARQGNYGSVSGLLRTLQNVGILGSFVVAITVASSSIPRQLAFQVFISTVKLSGGLSASFITGIQAALYASIVILAIAAVLSATREKKIEPNHQNRSKFRLYVAFGLTLKIRKQSDGDQLEILPASFRST